MKSILVLFALLFFGGSAAQASALSSQEMLDVLNERSKDQQNLTIVTDKIQEDIKTFKQKGQLSMSLANLVHLVLKSSEDLTVNEAVKMIVTTLEDNQLSQHNK